MDNYCIPPRSVKLQPCQLLSQLSHLMSRNSKAYNQSTMRSFTV